MPEHRVTVTSPKREVGNSDSVYRVYDDDGKIGELRISRGGVEWWPRDAKRGKLLSWEQFSSKMRR